MVNYSRIRLDTVFSALSDTTRRGILAALTSGSQPVTRLAQPFRMTLPGFLKHLDILEHAGLIAREKAGRVVTCTLSPDPLREAMQWLERYQVFWEVRLDALARYLAKEEASWPQPRTARRSRSSAGSRPRRRKSGARSRSRTR